MPANSRTCWPIPPATATATTTTTTPTITTAITASSHYRHRPHRHQLRPVPLRLPCPPARPVHWRRRRCCLPPPLRPHHHHRRRHLCRRPRPPMRQPHQRRKFTVSSRAWGASSANFTRVCARLCGRPSSHHRPLFMFNINECYTSCAVRGGDTVVLVIASACVRVCLCPRDAVTEAEGCHICDAVRVSPKRTAATCHLLPPPTPPMMSPQ